MISGKTKNRLITIGIVIGVIIIASIIIFIKSNKDSDYSEETIKCIGTNSTLYVQLGCSHCITQEKKFGKKKDLLNIIDCFYEKDICENITATPTWLINGKMYTGVYEIKELKNITGCE